LFQFVGYSAFAGKDCLDSAPSEVANITSTTLTNAIYDHYNVTKNVNLTYNTSIPQVWDYDTIMDAEFNGTLDAGNVSFILNQLSAIKIKRRKRGTFDWLTLETIPVNGVEDLTFAFIDRLNAYGVEYEYAFVPILNDVEGNYIINSVLSKFNGVFIGDFDNIYKFFYDVNYGTNARNMQTGIFTPLGNQYPVIIANGVLSYDSGTVIGSILNDDFEESGVLDVNAITTKKEAIKDFLTNKKAKILKDWSGNIWLCVCTNAPQLTYVQNSGLRIPQVSFEWTEIGDSQKQADLYKAGILDEPT
jgi:hypothetical protein